MFLLLLSHPASGEGNVTLIDRTFKPKGWQSTQLQIGFLTTFIPPKCQISAKHTAEAKTQTSQ